MKQLNEKPKPTRFDYPSEVLRGKATAALEAFNTINNAAGVAGYNLEISIRFGAPGEHRDLYFTALEPGSASADALLNFLQVVTEEKMNKVYTGDYDTE